MLDINLVRESIEFEQLINEKHSETMVRGEYLIPDTHPDVIRILMIDAKPTIVSAEVMQDKVYLEGQVEYTLLYYAKEDERLSVNSVFYTDKFNGHVDVDGAEHRMICEAECDVEHIKANIINERKISIDGIFNLRCGLFENKAINVIKDIDSAENVQMQKKNTNIDKIISSMKGDMGCKTTFQVSPERPEIAKILKVDMLLHKKDVKTLEGRVQCSGFCRINVLYKGPDGHEVFALEDDVYVSGDFDVENILPGMTALCDSSISTPDYNVREDDLGERRLLDVEAMIKLNIKVLCKESMDIVEDAYSPNMTLELARENNQLFMLLSQNNSEIIVRDNVYLEAEDKIPVQILSTNGKLLVLEKKLIENKVLVEGIIKADVIYRCSDDNSSVAAVSAEIPFNAAIEVPGLKIDMMVRVKGNLESIDTDIEANTLALKAVINLSASAYYKLSKDFIVDVKCIEEEKPKKHSSITIYVVQPGDNLWAVAKKYYITQEEITRLNELEYNDEIKAGDKLLIPGRAII